MGNLYWGDISATTTQGAGEIMWHSNGDVWEAKRMGLIHISFLVPSPVSGVGQWIMKAQQNMTIIRIDSCVMAATSADFNIEIHSNPTTAGVDALSADQQAVTSGASTTSIANPTINTDDWLFVDISAISGTPTVLTVTVVCHVT